MNILKLLLPKNSVAVIRDDNTVKQGLEKIRYYSYTAIPVITKDSRYAGTISEGDFLWHFVKGEQGQNGNPLDQKSLEHMLIRDILNPDKNPPVSIHTSVEEIVVHSMNQNFLPMVDDRGIFIGIVTRGDIIRCYYEETSGHSIRMSMQVV